MATRLSDAELVRDCRDRRSRKDFAAQLGIDEPILSRYENGKVSPSSETWMKIGNYSSLPLNLECYERGGMPRELVEYLRKSLIADLDDLVTERAAVKEYLERHGIHPEPVTEGLLNYPQPPESYSKTVEEFWKRNKGTSVEVPTAKEVKPEKSAKKGKARKAKK